MSGAEGGRSDGEPLDPVLLRLIEEFTERIRRGERPSVEEYAGRQPSLAASIRELFPAILLVERSQRGAPVPAGPPGVPTRSDSAAPGEIFRLGDYRILREMGRGGMGIVYEAVQESLGRRVALKLLPGGMLQDPRRLARFRREAKAAATLQHPNIVAVHGVGEDGGNHYYVMQFIEGEGLDRAIAELRRRRAGEERFATAARVGIQVAEALAYAHGQGIIHRDIKPSNLLLESQGKVWITDFGLAKSEGSGELTRSGEVVGTLLYMAPERFKGWSDPRSDVYSLGLVLYELLTLEPAFEDEDRSRLMRRILEEEPRRPRRIDRSVPRDLETIVLKAISKEPASRYPDALALAEDLRRFLAHEPIQARQSGALHRFAKWARRRPASAALVAVVILAVAVVLTGSLWYGARLKRESVQTEANLEKALEAIERVVQVGDEGLSWRPELDPVRRELLEEALKYYEGFLKEYGTSPLVRLRAARTYGRVAKMHGLAGLREDGRLALRRSMDLLDGLAREFPGNEVYREELGAIRSIATLLDSAALPPQGAEVSRFLVDGVSRVSGVAAADVDGDGKMDLAIAGRVSDTLVILRNEGARRFAPSPPYPTGVEPHKILACDLDGDGKEDLLTLDKVSMEISMFMNKGNGTLAKAVSCKLNFNPFDMVAADLDRDGLPEVAAVGGPGTLAIAKREPGKDCRIDLVSGVTPRPMAVVAGDFDGDGQVDLAVGGDKQTQGQISLHWNDGKGKFSTSTTIEAAWLSTLHCGDVDENGYLDFVTVGNGDGTISVVLNSGGRTFRPGIRFKHPLFPLKPWGVGLADLSGDGRLDLITSTEEAEGIVSIFLGDGEGLFPEVISYKTMGFAYTGCIRDLDGDGHKDIAIANGDTNDVAVMFHVADLLALPGRREPAQKGSGGTPEAGRQDKK